MRKRRRSMTRTLGACVVLILVGASAVVSAAAGGVATPDVAAVLACRVTTPRGITTRSYSVSGSLVRTSSGSTDVVTNTATGAVVMIDHLRQEFSETTAAEMAAFMEPAADPAALPPAVAVEVARTGRHRTMAGHDAEEFEMTEGELRVSAWVAVDLGPKPALVEALKVAYSALGRGGKRVAAMLEEANAAPGMVVGFSVRGRIPGVFAEDESVELSEMRTELLPAAAFQVPAGYRRVPSPYRRVNPSPPPSYASPIIPR